MLCGRPPFDGDTDTEILDKVKIGKYNFDQEEWKGVSEDAKKFIRKMLEYDVKHRYNAEQALNDPWLKKFSLSKEIDKPIAVNTLGKFRVNFIQKVLIKSL